MSSSSAARPRRRPFASVTASSGFRSRTCSAGIAVAPALPGARLLRLDFAAASPLRFLVPELDVGNWIAARGVASVASVGRLPAVRASVAPAGFFFRFRLRASRAVSSSWRQRPRRASSASSSSSPRRPTSTSPPRLGLGSSSSTGRRAASARSASSAPFRAGGSRGGFSASVSAVSGSAPPCLLRSATA